MFWLRSERPQISFKGFKNLRRRATSSKVIEYDPQASDCILFLDRTITDAGPGMRYRFFDEGLKVET